ncbi:histidine kinase [Flavobacterium suaedae]|uniref:Histidine kinase n=1 Tax=Flavobacterium suaedae TaxID=1767027 RepID=A0ABQ1JWI8_9FLAO|nr:Hpt domain-containing protein [Flavobacterium suaedae]GGB79299.1 histidine kinase [Flavobacterium suaedae]
MEQPNTNYIDELAGDDTIFRNKLINTIKDELPQEINIYKTNITSGNYNATADNVHKLKHKISVLGMEKSYYLAEKFEKNLKDNSTELQKEFEDVLSSIQGFVAAL